MTIVIIGITMQNSSVTVRLSPRDVEMMDKKIIEGYFTSRSDIIRYSIRHLMDELDEKERRLDLLARIADEKDITMEDVREAVREARKEVYREVYGDAKDAARPTSRPSRC